jgi:hypothetical protein
MQRLKISEGKKRMVIVGVAVGARSLLAALSGKFKRRDNLHITVIRPNTFVAKCHGLVPRK